MGSAKTRKIIISVIVITASVAYLFYLAAQSSWSYYSSVDEFLESPLYKSSLKDKLDTNRIIRLAGRVKNGSIAANPEKVQLDFELAGRKSTVAVRFYGMVPKNFAPDKELVIEGKVRPDGIFNADRILTRCESKYKVQLQEGLDKTKHE